MATENCESSTFDSVSSSKQQLGQDDNESKKSDCSNWQGVNPTTMSDLTEVTKSHTPILVSKSALSLKNRRDSYGVLIRHTTKNHRIQFKENISEVKEVENWKTYNSEEKTCVSCNLM